MSPIYEIISAQSLESFPQRNGTVSASLRPYREQNFQTSKRCHRSNQPRIASAAKTPPERD